MKRKIITILMCFAMVFALTGMVYADIVDGQWTWTDDYSACTYTDDEGVVYDANVTHEVTPATCEQDAYVTHTAKWFNFTNTKEITKPDSALGHDWKLVETTLIQGQGLAGYWECQREGCDAKYNANTMNLIDKSTTDATCWTNATVTKEGNVTGPDGKQTRIEGTRDVADTSHYLSGKVQPIAAKAATCEKDGNIAYWYCDECQKYWVDVLDEDKNVTGHKEITEADTIVKATGHDYKVSYEFAKNGKKCVAEAKCGNTGCEHPTVSTTVTMTANSDGVITSEVIQKPTSTEMGVTQYNATFANEIFSTQTKEVADIPCVYEGYWSDDHTKCVAKCKDKPDVDAIETSAETKNGITTYTAVFPLGSNIGPFTDEVVNENPMIAKGKTVKAKVGKAKKFSAKKAFSVKDAAGTVTYSKVKGSKYVKVAKNGKVTVKKGIKKGAYKVKVMVNASGNNEYVAGSQEVTLTVKVTKK